MLFKRLDDVFYHLFAAVNPLSGGPKPASLHETLCQAGQVQAFLAHREAPGTVASPVARIIYVLGFFRQIHQEAGTLRHLQLVMQELLESHSLFRSLDYRPALRKTPEY